MVYRMNSDKPRVKVIYIAGTARSGSTILTRTLGELDNTFAPGELRLIWERSFQRNDPCGCGEAIHDCKTWRQIVEEAFGGFSSVNVQAMINHQPRLRHLPLMLLPGHERLVRKVFSRYIDTLDRLYRSIGEVTGCGVIIDSSKSPLYGFVLRLVPSIDTYVVHLIRDPRGVQYSRIRRRARNVGRVRKTSVTWGALMWNLRNVSQEVLTQKATTPPLRLRYEDLIEDPIRTVEAIKTFIGEPNIGLPKISDEEILLKPNHSIAGSETRSDSGVVRLRVDAAWRTELAHWPRVIITLVTFPFLRRYGYTR